MDTELYSHSTEAVEDNINVFYSHGYWGIANMESGKKTMPCFDRVITSTKYIFVETNGCWGILDKELRIIVLPLFKRIIPINLVDREAYIEACRNSQSPSVLNTNGANPINVAVQNIKKIKYDYRVPIEFQQLEPVYTENDKANFYETTCDLEKATTGSFVAVTNKEIILINVDDTTISKPSDYNGKIIYLLWHYKDNLFITQDYKGLYGYATYCEGRLSQKYFKYSKEDNSTRGIGSSSLVFHRGGFVSVCCKESQTWSIFKYSHKKKSLDEVASTPSDESLESSSFVQLIPFVLEQSLEQTQNPNVFICRSFGKVFFIAYKDYEPTDLKKEERITTNLLNDKQNADSSYRLNLLCSCIEESFRVTSPYYDDIDLREDGLYDICSDYLYGICDFNANIIVPAQYETPLEWGGQLVLVSQNGKCGLINHLAKTIIPCSYDSVIVAKESVSVWSKECDYYDEYTNEYIGEHNIKYSLYNQIDYISPSADLQEEGYYILGVNSNNTVKNEHRTIWESLTYYVNKDKAKCDIFLPNGDYVTTFQVGFHGGIEYIKEYAMFVTYELSDFDKYNGEFFEKVSLYSCSLRMRSIRYEQAIMINSNVFLAYDNQNVGIMAVSKGKESLGEIIIPYVYKLVTLPINDIVYALKEEQKGKCILDVFDISNSVKKILSCLVGNINLFEDKKDITQDVFARIQSKENSFSNLGIILKEDAIDSVRWFPFEHYYENDDRQGNTYPSNEWLRDAFEDDPEAMWGRLD